MDDLGSLNRGSVYVFDAVTGQQLHRLQSNDIQTADHFGAAVALDGTTLVVGATGDDDNGGSSGSAYVFDVVTGQQLTKLVPNDGAAEDFFGTAVAVSGSRAICGAPEDDDMGFASGSAYLFDVATGQQLAKLVTLDQSTQAQLGSSVAIEGTTALVGALADHEADFYAGSAYIFDAFTGAYVRELQPDDAQGYANFGTSVALDAGRAFVGSPRTDQAGAPGSDFGAAYIFDVATGQQLEKLVAAPSDAGRFGWSVDMHGANIVAGRLYDSENGFIAGAAFVFRADDPLGTSYCSPALPNSSGNTGVLTATGSLVASDDLVTLVATDLAPNQFSFFLNSTTQGLSVPPGSQGKLCLGGAIGRYNADVLNTGTAGSVALELDLADTPTPTGPVAIQPGETWHFQLWFRDLGGTSNFTNGLSIAFE